MNRQDIVVTGVLIIDSKILLIRRHKDDSSAGYWECPKGRVEFAEVPAIALAREFKEETNLRIKPGRVLNIYSHQYNRDNTDIHVVDIEYLVELAADEQIENIKLHETEHDAWLLVDKADLEKLEPMYEDRKFRLVSMFD